MRDLILQFDHWLFLKINHDWTSPGMDGFFIHFTNLNKTEWFTHYFLPIFLLALIFWKKKKALQVISAIAITVAITDLTSARILKTYFDRARPPSTEMGAIARVPYSATSKSFPSNHALNSFAIASILNFYWPALGWFYWSFAFLMAYSRVYVGVHYPLDIIAGMILGVFLAVLIRKALLLRFKWFRKSDEEAP